MTAPQDDPRQPVARRAGGADGGWHAMHAALQGDLAVAAAESYARGERCLRVVHGDPEDDIAFSRLQRLQGAMEDLPELLGGHPDQLVRVISTTNTTTWWFTSTDEVPAQLVVDQGMQLVRVYAMPWWRTSEEPS